MQARLLLPIVISQIINDFILALLMSKYKNIQKLVCYNGLSDFVNMIVVLQCRENLAQIEEFSAKSTVVLCDHL
jgi:hypothetical protein